MHNKEKGNIGYSAVIYELYKNQFNVFVELGDNSRVDLVAEKNGQTKTIQVKYTNGEGKAELYLNKSGPNGYRYHYEKEDVDWFAIFHHETEKIAWVESEEACKNGATFTLRIDKPKNNQKKGIRLFSDYGIEQLTKKLS